MMGRRNFVQLRKSKAQWNGRNAKVGAIAVDIIWAGSSMLCATTQWLRGQDISSPFLLVRAEFA